MVVVLNMNKKIENYIYFQMNNKNFVIWMAGFYEGEGSVSNDISNRNRLRMSISQNDPTPLEKAKIIWGGSVRKIVRKSPASDKICTGYEWRISHNKSIIFFKDIQPYMIIPYKIKQFEKVIQIWKEPFDRRFKCNFCENDYASPSGRRRHEKKVHINTDASLLT